MSEKEIIEMYDRIDAAIVQLVLQVAQEAGHLEEDDDWLEARLWDYGLVGDIRENTIAFLERAGYKFPDTEEF